MEGVSEGVKVGTSIRTGTSLAMACTVLTTVAGRKLCSLRCNQGATSRASTIPRNTAPPSRMGRSRSCCSGSPQ